MLEKERFLAIKNLASDIRNENEEFFKKVSKMSVDDAIEEKNKLVDSIIDSMEIAFSDGENGKEERQIFRANFLIPDDKEFYKSYSEDKNIRNLMNKYAVSIEDIMSKISELNLYSKYLDIDTNSSTDKEADDFINEMVDLSEDKKEDLIKKTDDLSNMMDDFDDQKIDDHVNPEIIEEPKQEISRKENKPIETKNDPLHIFDGIPDDIPADEQYATQEAKQVSSLESDDLTDEDFDDEFETISKAVTNFIGKYDNTQNKYSKAKNDLDEVNKKLAEIEANQDALNKRIQELEDENNQLKSNNLESAKTLAKEREERKTTVNENLDLKSRVKSLEKKMKKSDALLKKIYKSISEK